jgi:hypothetical protein
MKEIQIQNRSTHLRSKPYVDALLAVAGDALLVRPDDVMPGAAETQIQIQIQNILVTQVKPATSC